MKVCPHLYKWELFVHLDLGSLNPWHLGVKETPFSPQTNPTITDHPLLLHRAKVLHGPVLFPGTLGLIVSVQVLTLCSFQTPTAFFRRTYIIGHCFSPWYLVLLNIPSLQMGSLTYKIDKDWDLTLQCPLGHWLFLWWILLFS